jgi:hypothetical protein
MMAQVATRGFRATVERHLLCFAMFWHALDIIWIWLFTVVYLMGIRPMTETRYDRAPGDSPALSGPKESTVRRGRLHDRTSSSRDSSRPRLLGRQHLAALGTWNSPRPCRACHRPDGSSPRLLPHITIGPDNTNNVLALAFGVLIVTLVVASSLWIMANLNDNMMPPPELMNLHLQLCAPTFLCVAARSSQSPQFR